MSELLREEERSALQSSEFPESMNLTPFRYDKVVAGGNAEYYVLHELHPSHQRGGLPLSYYLREFTSDSEMRRPGALPSLASDRFNPHHFLTFLFPEDNFTPPPAYKVKHLHTEFNYTSTEIMNRIRRPGANQGQYVFRWKDIPKIGKAIQKDSTEWNHLMALLRYDFTVLSRSYGATSIYESQYRLANREAQVSLHKLVAHNAGDNQADRRALNRRYQNDSLKMKYLEDKIALRDSVANILSQLLDPLSFKWPITGWTSGTPIPKNHLSDFLKIFSFAVNTCHEFMIWISEKKNQTEAEAHEYRSKLIHRLGRHVSMAYGDKYFKLPVINNSLADSKRVVRESTRDNLIDLFELRYERPISNDDSRAFLPYPKYHPELDFHLWQGLFEKLAKVNFDNLDDLGTDSTPANPD